MPTPKDHHPRASDGVGHRRPSPEQTCTGRLLIASAARDRQRCGRVGRRGTVGRPVLTAIVVAGSLLIVTGCALHGLAIRQDDRVELLRPDDRSTVSRPVEVRWRTDGLDLAGERAQLAVLVDHTPPRPGKRLAGLLDDAICQGQQGCPDKTLLAANGIHLTRADSIRLDDIPSLGTDSRGMHRVTIIVVDADGTRIGESAWSRRFRLEGE